MVHRCVKMFKLAIVCRTMYYQRLWLLIVMISYLIACVCGQRKPIGITSTKRGSSSLPTFHSEEQMLRVAKAQEMLKYMNLSVDPCNDFYEFACGNWAVYHPPVKCEPKTAQSELELQVSKDLQTLLEVYNLLDVRSRRKMKEFYLSCVAAGSNSDTEKEFFLHFVKKNGGMQPVPQTNWHPSYDWVQVVATLRANYGMDILIGLDIDTNMQTKRGNSIYLSEPASTLLPAEICSAETLSRVDINEEPYELVQKQVAEKLQNWLSMRSNDATRIAGDIVTFEFNLCRKTRQNELLTALNSDAEVDEDLHRGGVRYRTGQARLYHHNRHSNDQYTRHSLQQLTQHFGGLIDFKQYVDTVFGTSIHDHIYLRDEVYFTHLARLIKATSKPTLANYIMYRALSALSLPDEDLRSKRSQYCIESVLRYFPKFIGDIYSRKYSRAETQTDVEALFQQLSKAFDDSLTVEWMDENTRRAAKQKLAQFKVRFPRYQIPADINDLPIERRDYWHQLELVLKYNAKQELDRLFSTDYRDRGIEVLEAPAVNALLEPIESELLVGWGLLQPPFFHSLYPSALKYAMLGQRLARELTLAFDEQGWSSNPMSPMRWGEETAEGFRNRTHCFRTQYSNYLHNNPDEFRNATKLRQLIADSSGLNVAFRAYLGWLDYIDPSNRAVLSRETLPDMNFTNTQLFFINFAQTHCSAVYSEQTTAEFLPLDKHTAERYEVNGPLSNFVEFAREFNCPAGTEMNRGDKCVLY